MSDNVPVFIMANDVVLPEMVRLLASVRRHEPSADIRFIPFNDDTELCRRVAAIFGCTIADEDLSELDDFGHEIFDADPPQQPYPYMLGKIRKLAIFRQPGPAIYLDIDTILVSRLFEIVKPKSEIAFDLGFISPSNGWIYEENEESKSFLAKTKAFSSGFLMVNPKKFNLELIKKTIRENLELYRKVRKTGVMDQPLLNFVTDFNNLQVESLPDLLSLSAHTVATSESISFKVRIEADGKMIQMWQGKEKQVLFLHAAGKYKHHAEYDFLFKSHLYDGMVHLFRHDQELGLRLLEIVDAWRPGDNY